MYDIDGESFAAQSGRKFKASKQAANALGAAAVKASAVESLSAAGRQALCVIDRRKSLCNDGQVTFSVKSKDSVAKLGLQWGRSMTAH